MSFPPEQLSFTKAEVATEILRRRIRQGEVQPGEPLRIYTLTHELGMSSTPVREALRTLEADGLVDYAPHRGATVAESVGDDTSMEEVFRMRLLLEPYACRIATGRLDEGEVAKLEQIHTSLLRAANSSHTSRSRISEHNSTWHFSLYAGAGMPLLSELIQRLWDMMPWRSFWTVSATTSVSIEEHDAIMDAIRDRDGGRAAELMGTHIQHGLDYLENEREKGFEE
jgi:DNA-binding GntR family transcriptional regulator